MRTTVAHPMSWAFAGVVVMFASIAASDSVSQEQLEPVATVAETVPTTPYARATWVKLDDLVPTGTNAPNLYVRLIAIEGEGLLPPHNDK